MDEPIHDGDPSLRRAMYKRSERAKWGRVASWGMRGLVFFLTIAVFLLLGIIYQNRDLPDLVDAQRQQFLKCKDIPANSPGCNTPVVTKRDVEKAKDGQRGLPGLQGSTGRTGATGPPGSAPSFAEVLAAVGKQISAAVTVNCGGSCKGKPGVNGQTIMGDKGDKGEKGDKGDKGSTGDAGKDGAPGADAPVISSVICDGSTGIITLSDQTTFRVDNMCNPPELTPPGIDQETP